VPLPVVSFHPSGYAHHLFLTPVGSPEQVELVLVVVVQPEKLPREALTGKLSANT
jgi:hypothetical protein